MQFLSLFSAALTFAAVVYAQTNGQNAITYPLGGTLDSSTPVMITWTPTTAGTITIKLLKGPPTNILDANVIAASIENSGSFTWNIPNSLQDSLTMPKGDRYGFKIIDDLTNTFEYSPPFDLSIPDSTFVVAGSTPIASVSTPTVTSQPASATSIAPPSTTTSATTAPESTDLPTSTPIPTSTPTQLETTLQTVQPTAPATTTSPSAITQSTSTTAQPNATGSGPKSGPSMTLILSVAGGVVGGLILAVIALVSICRCKNRRKRQSSSIVQNQMMQRPTSVLYGDGMYNRV